MNSRELDGLMTRDKLSGNTFHGVTPTGSMLARYFLKAYCDYRRHDSRRGGGGPARTEFAFLQVGSRGKSYQNTMPSVPPEFTLADPSWSRDRACMGLLFNSACGDFGSSQSILQHFLSFLSSVVSFHTTSCTKKKNPPPQFP